MPLVPGVGKAESGLEAAPEKRGEQPHVSARLFPCICVTCVFVRPCLHDGACVHVCQQL